MANFDERSGVVNCTTPWGAWYQTNDEVVALVNVPEGSSAKQLTIAITPTRLKCVHKGAGIHIEGDFPQTIVVDDSVWTLEDKKLVRITLVKSARGADQIWRSLLKGQFKAGMTEFDDMEKKATLEKMQRENPGFDFSGADITGNYRGGGPQMPNSS